MITSSHLLAEANQRQIPGGRPMKVRRCVVIHYTSGASAQSSIDYWNEPKSRAIDLGAHIIIDRDGTVFQCRPFDRTMSHAGVSRWVDPNTGILYKSCNGFSIGIELANAGDSPAVQKIATRLPGYAGEMQARHRNGGKVKTWERYSEHQYAACLDVVRQLVARYNLDDITGHDCIAPERKVDPGPAFPMHELRDACGLKGLPVVHWA